MIVMVTRNLIPFVMTSYSRSDSLLRSQSYDKLCDSIPTFLRSIPYSLFSLYRYYGIRVQYVNFKIDPSKLIDEKSGGFMGPGVARGGRSHLIKLDTERSKTRSTISAEGNGTRCTRGPPPR